MNSRLTFQLKNDLNDYQYIIRPSGPESLEIPISGFLGPENPESFAKVNDSSLVLEIVVNSKRTKIRALQIVQANPIFGKFSNFNYSDFSDQDFMLQALIGEGDFNQRVANYISNIPTEEREVIVEQYRQTADNGSLVEIFVASYGVFVLVYYLLSQGLLGFSFEATINDSQRNVLKLNRNVVYHVCDILEANLDSLDNEIRSLFNFLISFINIWSELFRPGPGLYLNKILLQALNQQQEQSRVAAQTMVSGVQAQLKLLTDQINSQKSVLKQAESTIILQTNQLDKERMANQKLSLLIEQERREFLEKQTTITELQIKLEQQRQIIEDEKQIIVQLQIVMENQRLKIDEKEDKLREAQESMKIVEMVHSQETSSEVSNESRKIPLKSNPGFQNSSSNSRLPSFQESSGLKITYHQL